MPLVYIYGYTADLTELNGNRHASPVAKDEMGLISVSDEGETSGTIRIAYEKTTVQKASELISCLTLAAVLIMLLRKKRAGNH